MKSLKWKVMYVTKMTVLGQKDLVIHGKKKQTERRNNTYTGKRRKGMTVE